MDIGLNRVFGAVVRRLRQERELSQDKLAEHTGLHVNTIHLLERGVTEAKISTFLFVSKALGITADELMRIVIKQYHEK